MYKRALALDPQHISSLVNLANLIAAHRNDTDTAVDLYTKALDIEPNSPGIVNNLALVQVPTPEPQTPNPKPRTPNPEPRTPNPEPELLKPKP